MLHEGHALALDRLRDKHLRPVVMGTELGEDAAQLVVIVTVARGDVPAKRCELRLEIAEREYLVSGFVGLELVAIDEYPEISGRMARRRLQRLEVLALLQLAVTRHHDDAPRTAEECLCPCHPPALGDAHPERARVRLDPRNRDVRMAVETAEAAQPQQPLRGNHSERVQ